MAVIFTIKRQLTFVLTADSSGICVTPGFYPAGGGSVIGCRRALQRCIHVEARPATHIKLAHPPGTNDQIVGGGSGRNTPPPRPLRAVPTRALFASRIFQAVTTELSSGAVRMMWALSPPWVRCRRSTDNWCRGCVVRYRRLRFFNGDAVVARPQGRHRR